MARILHSTKASLVFVSETKCGTDQAIKRIARLPLKNHEIVPSVGKSGGLWLLWDDTYQVDILERSHYYIFAKITSSALEPPWILGAIYGDPHDFITEYIWERIVHYATVDPRPLCVIGDFNSIYAPLEKYGGSSRTKRKHRLFQSMIATAGLVDLGYHGPAYTRANNQSPSRFIMQRLDRALGSVPWCAMYPEAKLFHLPRRNSDHCPILLSLKPMRKPGPKNFKFENWWVYREDFKGVCQKATENSGLQWNNVLHNLKNEVKKWVRKVKKPDWALVEAEQKLIEAQYKNTNLLAGSEMQALQREYNSRLLEVEAYWAQRARVRWAEMGDMNTTFFHQAVAQRRRINRISNLEIDSEGLCGSL